MRQKTIISICILAFLACGCRKSELEGDPEQASPISLGAAVTATKAPITDGQTMTVAVVGWEASDNLMPVYAQSNWLSTASVQASTAPQHIDLNPIRYYNPQTECKTFIKAAHPVGTIDQNGVLLFDKSEVMKTGAVDVMIAGAISGSRQDSGVKNLEFRHLLSLVKFKIVAVENFRDVMVLKSIKIVGAELARGIDFTLDTIVPFDRSDFDVRGIAPQAAFGVRPTDVGDGVMVRPWVGNQFVAIITTELRTPEGAVTPQAPARVVVTIDRDPNFLPGKMYTVTVKRFSSSTLDVGSVSVEEWSAVGGGSGVVEW